MINPLDYEEKIATHPASNYQYEIRIVPTRVESAWSSLDTYQYSVNEFEKIMNHSSAGTHGSGGIFIKYDLAALKVLVKEGNISWLHILTRLCGITGGVFATCSLFRSFISAASQSFTRRLT